MLATITHTLKLVGLITLPLAIVLQMFAGISVGQMLMIALSGAACFCGAQYIERRS